MKERLRELRKERGISQKELADILGISNNMVFMMEKGTRPISDRTIKDICREFSVNEEWLRFGVEPKNKENFNSRFIDLANQLDATATIPDLQTKEMLSKLLEIWVTLDKEHKKVLFEVIEKLKEEIKKD